MPAFSAFTYLLCLLCELLGVVVILPCFPANWLIYSGFELFGVVPVFTIWHVFFFLSFRLGLSSALPLLRSPFPYGLDRSLLTWFPYVRLLFCFMGCFGNAL
jgi:hypothetical protein